MKMRMLSMSSVTVHDINGREELEGHVQIRVTPESIVMAMLTLQQRSEYAANTLKKFRRVEDRKRG